MKIFKNSIFAATLILLSALSCDKTEGPVSMPQVTETVTYSVALDQQTKALGEGYSVTHIWCAAYKVVNDNGVISYTLSSESLSPFVDGTAQCKVDMVRDQSYKVVFVGQHYNGQSPVYQIVKESARINMPVIAATNSDDYDLFTYVDPVTDFKPRAAKNVTLSRQVAQINFVASSADLTAAAIAGRTPTHSAVSLTSVPEYISILDGTASTSTVDVQYAKSPLTGEAEQLATVFCLSSKDGNDVVASLYIYKENEELKKYESIAQIPSKVNYKTNVTVSYTFE